MLSLCGTIHPPGGGGGGGASLCDTPSPGGGGGGGGGGGRHEIWGEDFTGGGVMALMAVVFWGPFGRPYFSPANVWMGRLVVARKPSLHKTQPNPTQSGAATTPRGVALAVVLCHRTRPCGAPSRLPHQVFEQQLFQELSSCSEPPSPSAFGRPRQSRSFLADCR